MIQRILFPQYTHFQREKVPSLYNTISTKIDLYPVISGCKFYKKWLSCLLSKQKLSNHLSKVNNKLTAAKYFLTILFANQDFLKTIFLEFLYGQKNGYCSNLACNFQSKQILLMIWQNDYMWCIPYLFNTVFFRQLRNTNCVQSTQHVLV